MEQSGDNGGRNCSSCDCEEIEPIRGNVVVIQACNSIKASCKPLQGAFFMSNFTHESTGTFHTWFKRSHQVWFCHDVHRIEPSEIPLLLPMQYVKYSIRFISLMNQ